MQEEFLNEMEVILQEDFPKYLESLQHLPRKAVRLNTSILQDKSSLNGLLKEEIPFDKNSYFIEEEKPGNTLSHTLGLFYVQEPSAMMPVLATEIAKDAKILDLCASPGGKTLQLSNLAKDGIIYANEFNPSRARKLVSNIERLGLKNCIVTQMTSKELKQVFQGYFDYILVDAPCSLEGTFRKDPLAIELWSKSRVLEMASLQKTLLKDAVCMLKSEGKLVYSTCTFSKEENEEVVKDALSLGNLHVLAPNPSLLPFTKEGLLEYGNTFKNTRRGYPFLLGEGQFFAVLQKEKEKLTGTFQNAIEELSKEEEKMLMPFLSETLQEIPFSIFKYHNQFIAVPFKTVEVPHLKTAICFVKIGEFQKGRFLFHHQFARCYGTLFKNKLSLSKEDPLVKKYLSGLELEMEVPDGWGVLLVEGYPLGLFKASHGKLKNHYPKGLRKS